MIKTITRKEYNTLVRQVKDALKLASTHDPDLVKELKETNRRLDRVIDHLNREIGVARDLPLVSRLEITERQLQRIGAPQYRRVK